MLNYPLTSVMQAGCVFRAFIGVVMGLEDET